MQTTYSLRRFQPSDLEQVMYINRTCLPENYTSSFFMELYESYPETFIVAEENGGIVGYIMCRIESGVPGLNFLGKKGHVVSIAVLPQHQRKGIGSALLQEAMRNMKHYKAKECYLEVRISNEAAISLYKKLGFRITRTLHGYYADGEAAYIMTKKLAQSSS